MEDLNVTAVADSLGEILKLYLPKIGLAILTLIIGLWLIGKVINIVRKVLTKRNVDPSLTPFLSSITKVALVIILLISVAGMVGIETTSFVAVLGAAGLAIGLALQGSLSNFAGGVLILLLKPFRVGETIEAQGVIATIQEIQIFHTYLLTFDKKYIILPNGPLANDKIINYSRQPTRLVEWTFGISYDDDIDLARQIIKQVIFSDSRIILAEDAEPFIRVAELADSSVNIKVRAEALQTDFWPLFWDKMEEVKKAFDAKNITIPYPQRDVHMYQH
jgi:small conductance mechanosensitive channel